MSETTTISKLAVRDVPEQSFVVLRDRVPMERLGEVIPRLIGETHAWLAEHAGFSGAPMAAVSFPDEDGVVDLEVGWPVAAPLEPAAPIELVTYEATRAVVHVHVGPFDDLPETYAALARAIEAAGLRAKGPARESYETNPEQEPDPRKWVTRIVWPVE